MVRVRGMVPSATLSQLVSVLAEELGYGKLAVSSVERVGEA